MSEQQTSTPQQQQARVSPVRPAPTQPLPIDPSLLRQIGGGVSTGSPNTGW
jgi:hypothetical protein